jgi:hypothetical protein
MPGLERRTSGSKVCALYLQARLRERERKRERENTFCLHIITANKLESAVQLHFSIPRWSCRSKVRHAISAPEDAGSSLLTMAILTKRSPHLISSVHLLTGLPSCCVVLAQHINLLGNK